jgi:hypothetical protein
MNRDQQRNDLPCANRSASRRRTVIRVEHACESQAPLNSPSIRLPEFPAVADLSECAGVVGSAAAIHDEPRIAGKHGASSAAETAREFAALMSHATCCQVAFWEPEPVERCRDRLAGVVADDQGRAEPFPATVRKGLDPRVRSTVWRRPARDMVHDPGPRAAKLETAHCTDEAGCDFVTLQQMGRLVSSHPPRAGGGAYGSDGSSPHPNKNNVDRFPGWALGQSISCAR